MQRMPWKNCGGLTTFFTSYLIAVTENKYFVTVTGKFHCKGKTAHLTGLICDIDSGCKIGKHKCGIRIIL